MQLLLGRGRRNGGWKGQEGANLSFYTAYDFYHVRCYLSTNINNWRLCRLVCCPSGDLFCSAVTQWPSKHLPIPQPATPSWPSSPHASGDGLCLSKTACRKSWRGWRLQCKKTESSGCFGACFSSQPTDQTKINHPPFWSFHTRPPWHRPWHPASALPTMGRPSRFHTKIEGLAQYPTEFSQLPYEVSLLAPFSKLKN